MTEKQLERLDDLAISVEDLQESIIQSQEKADIVQEKLGKIKDKKLVKLVNKLITSVYDSNYVDLENVKERIYKVQEKLESKND